VCVAHIPATVQVPTLEEYLDVARSAHRPVGIYPETKHPAWHDGLPILKGTSISDMLLKALEKLGYRGDIHSRAWAKQPCFN
jgi:glycerophosphoryl diester phosphodiesterase